MPAVTAPEKSKPEGVDVHLPGPAAISGERFKGVLVRLPDAAGLPEALAMARAMRPFRRRQPTTRFVVLDESRTAERLAVSDIWLPVLSPGQERWLSAAVVVDCGASMAVWQTVLREFRHLLETLGAFRTVAEWWLDTEDPAWTLGADSLTPLFASRRSRVYRRPLDVVDPSGRQFILVVSDCVSDAWWDGRVARLLRLWGRINQTAILQVLPRTMWERTALGPEHEQEIVLRLPRPACPNSHLEALVRTPFRGLRKVSEPGTIPMPVLEFSAGPLGAWSRWVVRDAGETHPGRLLPSAPPPDGSGRGRRLDGSDRSAVFDAGLPGGPQAGQPHGRGPAVQPAPLAGHPREHAGRRSEPGPRGRVPAQRAGHDRRGACELRFERPDEVLYDFRSDELRRTLRRRPRPGRAQPAPHRAGLPLPRRAVGTPEDLPRLPCEPGRLRRCAAQAPLEHSDPIARFTSDILQWFGGPYAGLLRKTTSPTPVTSPGTPEARPHPHPTTPASDPCRRLPGDPVRGGLRRLL